jgi:ESCRT-I complex subunit VPS28
LKLLAQYKTCQSLLALNLEDFMSRYNLSCPAAVKRLELGVPATVEHATLSNLSPKNIAEAVQLFITLMDSLKLNYVAVDQLHPMLSDLVQSLNRIYQDKIHMNKLKEWLILLNKRKASDELDAEQVRQLLFDLESCYTNFQQTLVN